MCQMDQISQILFWEIKLISLQINHLVSRSLNLRLEDCLVQCQGPFKLKEHHYLETQTQRT